MRVETSALEPLLSGARRPVAFPKIIEGLFVSRDRMTPKVHGSGTDIACRTKWLRERRVLPSHLVKFTVFGLTG